MQVDQLVDLVVEQKNYHSAKNIFKDPNSWVLIEQLMPEEIIEEASIEQLTEFGIRLDNKLSAAEIQNILVSNATLTGNIYVTIASLAREFFLAQRKYLTEFERLLPEESYTKTNLLAPNLFANQPAIPYVLFIPNLPETAHSNQNTLIVHTHGGPNVYFDKDTKHAEIAYFLSKGYMVACPNYRGSTGYPEEYEEGKLAWQAIKDEADGKYALYGPEDVYTVTKDVLARQPHLSSVFLRGGSFGSYINAHLLAGIKAGKFERLYQGVHLSGGVHYPPARDLADIAILISHGVQDDIAPFNEARFFMEKMLLKDIHHHIQDPHLGHLVQTFIAAKGDHHLIEAKVTREDKDAPAYLELKQYLSLAVGFIDNLANHQSFTVEEPLEQLSQMLRTEQAPLKEHDLDTVIEKKIQAYQYAELRRLSEKKQNTEIHPLPVLAHPNVDKPHGPTLALLKLYLKETYTGNIEQDLITYLRYQFKPLDWDNLDKVVIEDAGEQILKNGAFVKHLVEMIQYEEQFLADHPKHVVLYHAAETNSLYLYSFINIWKNILQGKLVGQLSTIQDMRLFEYIKKSFNDIEIFLLRMNRLREEETPFNYTEGFNERAIACNPTLISYAHSTSSCSLWWYYKAKSNTRAPIEDFLIDFFNILGISSKERINRYKHLFEHWQKLHSQEQALMQQIFLPLSLAKKTTYLCQFWGEEFKKNSLGLSSPAVIKQLVDDAEHFETSLRLNKDAFTNFGELNFGEANKLFNYAGTIQARYIHAYPKLCHIQSYFRSPRQHQQFVEALSQLIYEDFSDYLSQGKRIPKCIIKKADLAKREICVSEESGIRFYKRPLSVITPIRFFKEKTDIAEELLLKQQYNLFLGLVQNPDKSSYGKITKVTQETREKLQVRLSAKLKAKELGFMTKRVSLYSLCIYLKGYTYFNLLDEMATGIKLTSPPATSLFNEQKIKQLMQANYNRFMKLVKTYSIPASVDIALCSADYEFLQTMVRRIKSYTARDAFNLERFDYFQPEEGVCYPSYLFNLELNNMVASFMHYARLAKEKYYGYDFREFKAQLF